MEFTYDKGEMLEGNRRFEGILTLAEYKLYLKDATGEMPQTFIPLDKIRRVTFSGDSMSVEVRLTISQGYTAVFRGRPAKVKELCLDLVKRRGMNKLFLRNTWVDPEIP
jgi:hypothetical protein